MEGGEETEGEGVVEDEERWVTEVVGTGAGDLLQASKQEEVEAEELSVVSMVDLLKVGGLDTMILRIEEALVKAGMEVLAKEVKDMAKEVEDMAKEVEDMAKEVKDMAFRELEHTAKEAEDTVVRELEDMAVRDTTSLVVGV